MQLFSKTCWLVILEKRLHCHLIFLKNIKRGEKNPGLSFGSGSMNGQSLSSANCAEPDALKKLPLLNIVIVILWSTTLKQYVPLLCSIASSSVSEATVKSLISFNGSKDSIIHSAQKRFDIMNCLSCSDMNFYWVTLWSRFPRKIAKQKFDDQGWTYLQYAEDTPLTKCNILNPYL